MDVSQVDGHTFVVTKAPDVPVRQTVSDLTMDEGGLAGILCGRIEEDIEEIVGEYPFPDPTSPRLHKFMVDNKQMELLLDDTGSDLQIFEEVGLYLKKKRTMQETLGSGTPLPG